jgi:hypothetical protein
MKHNIKVYTQIARSRNRLIAMAVLLGFSLASCNKEVTTAGTASLSIINAMPGSNDLIPNFKQDGAILYRQAAILRYKIFFMTDNRVRYYSGQQRLRIYQMPDTTSKDQPLYDLNLDLPVGSIHTLFLTGSPDAPDTVMIRNEQIPFFPQSDSAMAIRFVNLSKGSAPVSINIKGLADGSEVQSLSYKTITGFAKYPVRLQLQDYVFEFRDAATGTLLASYTTLGLQQTTPNPWIYKSFTIAFTGIPGTTGATAPDVFLVPHY